MRRPFSRNPSKTDTRQRAFGPQYRPYLKASKHGDLIETIADVPGHGHVKVGICAAENTAVLEKHWKIAERLESGALSVHDFLARREIGNKVQDAWQAEKARLKAAGKIGVRRGDIKAARAAFCRPLAQKLKAQAGIVSHRTHKASTDVVVKASRKAAAAPAKAARAPKVPKTRSIAMRPPESDFGGFLSDSDYSGFSAGLPLSANPFVRKVR